MDETGAARGGKNYAVALKHLRAATAVKVAERTGISDTTLGDFVNKGGLERACAILAASGLKVVHESEKTYKAETIASMRHLAQIGLAVEPDTDFGNDI